MIDVLSVLVMQHDSRRMLRWSGANCFTNPSEHADVSSFRRTPKTREQLRKTVALGIDWMATLLRGLH